MARFLTTKASLRIRLVFMDCDGIVFNSNHLKTDAYRGALRGMGVSPADAERFVTDYHLADVSVSRFVKFERFFVERGGDASAVAVKVEEALAAYASSCMKLYATLAPRREALAVADGMAAGDGVYIVSGGSEEELRVVFGDEMHGVASKFRAICGSPVVKIEHVTRILAETGIAAEETLFIGDGWTDFKTARAAGCAQFLFIEEMSDWRDCDERIAEHPENVTRCATWADALARFTFPSAAAR
jgi:phosphoglycolate phosphatase-like HAD superfamily hydrolase